MSAASGSASSGRGIETFAGMWKRTLQTRLFGSFMPHKDTSTLVYVARASDDVESLALRRPPRYRWNFGRTAETLRTGYTVEVMEGGTADSVPLRVSFAGRSCYGMFQGGDLGVLTIHLMGSINATVVYRIMDDDTIAVSITEVPTKGPAIVQTGFMFRVRTPLPPATTAPTTALAAAGSSGAAAAGGATA